MQVWTKLTLGFALTAVVIVGAYGASQLRQEERDLRAAAERDLRLIGTALQVALGHAFRDQQAVEVRELIDAVTLRDPSVEVLVFDARGAIAAGSGRETATEDLLRGFVADAQGTTRATIRFEGPDDLSHLLGAFPIRDDRGSSRGTVVVVRPLDELQRDLALETSGTVLSLLTLALALAGAGWLLTSVYVRRPLLTLIDTMRAVRAGDLSARASCRRADEIGAAVAEFNALTDDLGQARRQLVVEAEARETMEASLRRADKLVTVGQLSAGLAHEIGSPLQILSGRARALAARAELPPDVQRTAEILANESDRITRIVEQLLAFSRRSAPCVTDAQLRGPVRDIVEIFEVEARHHNVRLKFDCDEALPTATVDVGQVQQVVMNLLSNAVRAARQGGQVRVRLGTSSVRIDGAAPRASVSLVVEDTGDGISGELMPHIFEPFFTARAEAGGTGLGLAIVKSIVDSHGGAITVMTRAGEGTRFTVHFPATNAAATGSAAVA